MKHWKSTAVGITALLFVIASIILVYLEKATLTEVGTILGIAAASFTGILGIITKDSDK